MKNSSLLQQCLHSQPSQEEDSQVLVKEVVLIIISLEQDLNTNLLQNKIWEVLVAYPLIITIGPRLPLLEVD